MPLDPDALRQQLRQTYLRETWTGETGLFRQLLAHAQVDFREKPALIEHSAETAHRILQLGVITLGDGKRLGVFEIELANTSTQIARNRVGLRELARRLIDEATIHGALAFYHHPQLDEYRFSFIARQSRLAADGALTTDETHPKRFTYILGPHETRTTAVQRFLLLATGPATLAGLTEAFSVEKLSRDFFLEYKARYGEFSRHLLGLPDLVRKRAFGHPDDPERQGKRIRDFAKKLLGRLVFLHFLQKKGWLGAPAGRTDWTGGDAHFFENLLRQHPRPAKFYSEVLSVLFFQTLNTRRPGDLFALTGTRVPYLNGGLFDDDPEPTQRLDFPPALFQDLFAFFGRFNFTIDENAPDDQEVGIDPEMLGRIFEDLISENEERAQNKALGAYYTPREVVHYMCQHGLYRYLRGQLLADSIAEDAPEATLLRKFVYTYDRGAPGDTLRKYLEREGRHIEEALDRVKICDPAIGSGAFPIGLLQVIFTLKTTLDLTLDRAAAKRAIIQNSIHGVDLDAGAVDIARLRFWLSLVVDEDAPSPLPNLDYKIMQGNALLEWFEGIALDELAGAKARTPLPGQMSMFTAPGDTADLGSTPSENESAQFTQLLRDYFSIEGKDRKNALHARIDQRVLQFIDDRIAEVQDALDTERHLHIEESRRLRREASRRSGHEPRPDAEVDAFLAKDARYLKAQRCIAELNEQIEANEKRRLRLRELQASETPERPFFLWHFYFQDVFAQGGFDLVIANPPYIRADHPSQVQQRKDVLACGKFHTLWEKWDLFVAFIEQSFHLLKPGGVMAQIVSDGYCHAKYAQKSQNWFLENARIVRLDFVSELKLFAAGVRNIIFFVEKADGRRWRPERRLHLDRSDRLPEDAILGQVRLLPTDEQRNLTHRTFFPEDAVAKSFSTPTVRLSDVFYVSVGMVISADEKRAKGAFEMDDLLSQTADATHTKRFAEGKQLGRWAPLSYSWLEWGTERAPVLFRRPTFPELYEVTEKILVQRSPGPDPKACFDTQQLHFTESTVGFVRWADLKDIKNNSIKKVARYAGETPKREDLPNRSSLEETSARFSPKFVLAVLNSSFVDRFLKSIRRSQIHVYPDDWKQLPIPDVSPEQQAPIVALVEKILAAKRVKPDADVSILEAEVDRLVTALYGLGEEKGAPPARVKRTEADAKAILRDNILADLARRSPYIPLTAIRAELKTRKVEMADSSLLNYLQEIVASGFLHDAGRGWYSTIARPLVLDRSAVQPVAELIHQAFPQLGFSVWSTQQINPWMHHLLGKFVTFVHVEKEGVASVWELLRDAGYDAYRNPGKREAKNFAVRDKTVVVRPGTPTQAPVDGHYATPEKLLVDLAAELDDLPLMDPAELTALFLSASRDGRLDFPELLRYSDRKRLGERFLNLINSVTSQNGDS